MISCFPVLLRSCSHVLVHASSHAPRRFVLRKVFGGWPNGLTHIKNTIKKRKGLPNSKRINRSANYSGPAGSAKASASAGAQRPARAQCLRVIGELIQTTCERGDNQTHQPTTEGLLPPQACLLSCFDALIVFCSHHFMLSCSQALMLSYPPAFCSHALRRLIHRKVFGG